MNYYHIKYKFSKVPSNAILNELKLSFLDSCCLSDLFSDCVIVCLHAGLIMLSNIIILIGSDVLGHWSVYIYFDNVLERGSICCPGWTWIQLLVEGQCPTLSSVTNQQTHTHTHTSVPISSRRH